MEIIIIYIIIGFIITIFFQKNLKKRISKANEEIQEKFNDLNPNEDFIYNIGIVLSILFWPYIIIGLTKKLLK